MIDAINKTSKPPMFPENPLLLNSGLHEALINYIRLTIFQKSDNDRRKHILKADRFIAYEIKDFSKLCFKKDFKHAIKYLDDNDCFRDDFIDFHNTKVISKVLAKEKRLLVNKYPNLPDLHKAFFESSDIWTVHRVKEDNYVLIDEINKQAHEGYIFIINGFLQNSAQDRFALKNSPLCQLISESGLSSTSSSSEDYA